MMEYTGPISKSKMPPIVYKAYKSIDGQRQRAKRGNYTVDYGTREFINWWLKELKKREKWHKPSVNRIDHSIGYNFKNIFLDECSINTAERNSRHTKAIKVFKGKKCVFIAKSILEAAKFASTRPNNIPAACKGFRKTLNGYRFKYA